MLTLALTATLIGFVVLVLGLVTGQVWLAVACIVVCLIGLGFLLADVFGSSRDSDDRTAAGVTGGRRGVLGRSDDDDDADDDDDDVAWGDDTPSRVRGGVDISESDNRTPETPAPETSTPDIPDEAEAPQREGDLSDYLRSVGGPELTGPPRAHDPQPAPRRPGPQVSASPQAGPRDNRPSAPGRPDNRAGRTVPPRPQQPSRPPEPPRPPTRRPAPKFDPLDPNWHPPAD
ncbi:hypothetical protein QSJ18_11725 [Gordonia sp. ABSL1-1]|uniref:hypothetical protein n=1 Tax=Gordonia sp. ABSL1-1 TaxID=3053923 RepID=UPI0025728394|nr:hypothetical protein [Gordonia sp. ABSL1-1]MDL9937415.1 hypothetical protein [Gordonia sp. ABSL1-1]